MRAPGRPPPVDRELLRRVPALSRHLVVAAVASLAVAGAVIIQANSIAAAIAAMMVPGTANPVPALLAGLLVVIALRGLAAASVELSATSAMQATRTRLRDALLDHAGRDAAPGDSGVAGHRAKTATTGLDELEPYVRTYLPALVAAVVVPTAAWIRIVGVDLVAALIVAVTVPLIPVFMILIGTVTEHRTQRRWATLQRLSGHLLDVLEGVPTLRLFGRIGPATKAVRAVSDRYRSVTMGTLRIAFLSAFALELIATLSVAVVAVSIGLRLAGGNMELEPALVVLLLVGECYLPLRRVGAAFHASQVGVDASAEVTELLRRPSLPGGTAEPPASAISLRGVQVTREERRGATDPIDIDLAPGEVVAVVGRSGSGKTTLLDVVRGRVSPTAGSVLIGEAPLTTLDPDAWADEIAVIRQHPHGVAATVRDELLSDDEDLATATLRTLGLEPYADVAAARLSGGQQRRVEVARAVAAVRSGRASIVVADEPTAHLDAASAGVVRGVLLDLARRDNAAVLVATHDAALASRATRVVDLSGDWQRGRAPAASAEPGEAEPVGIPAAATNEAATAREVAIPTAARTVLEAARGLWGRLAAATGLGALAEVSSVGLAGVAAWLVLRASEQPTLAALAIAVTAVRTFGIGKGVCRYAERLATHDAALRVVNRLRESLVARIGRIAPGGIIGWRKGDIARRVVEDVDRLVDLFARLLVPAASVLITGFAAAAVAVLIDPAAGAILTAGVLTMGVILPLVAARSEVVAARHLATARSAVAAAVLDFCEQVDALVGHRLIRRERARIAIAAREVDRLERRRGRLRAGRSAVVAAAPAVTAALAALAVAPTAPAAIGPAIGLLIIWPLSVVEMAATLVDSAAGAPHVAAAATRTATILTAAEIEPPAAESLRQRGVVSITLAGASARWPGQQSDAFRDVALGLEPGERLALTGPSGSGKSTVAAVLVRFLDLTAGEYTIDGINAAAVPGDDVRSRITWIEQTPWLADSTVRQNLLIARPDATDSELLAALETVQLADWVAAGRDGLDTEVGKGGAAVSGGEAQRMGIARALLSGHGVVVLDEPGAFLDDRTAARVLPATFEAMRGRSVLTISHRPIDAAGPVVELTGRIE